MTKTTHPTDTLFRRSIGTIGLTVLLDGIARRPISPLLSAPQQAHHLMAAVGRDIAAPRAINCFLLEMARRHILVDTGAGPLFGDDGGWLMRSLGYAGHSPDQIDTILLTHIHDDHSAGLTDAQGHPLFPNAQIYLNTQEAEFWLDPQAEEKHPDRAHSIRHGKAALTPYRNRLHLFTAPGEVVSGITAVPLYGHTPGHSGFLIDGGDEKLLLWGDIVHVTEAQLAVPAITIAYDIDPAAAAASRRTILSEAAAQGYLVGGAHIDFPALGYVCTADKKETGYHWQPVCTDPV